MSMLVRFRTSPPMRASALTAVQFGSAQVLRFVNNLALAYLLFEEAFGLMAMVYVVMTALSMFSDVGLGPSIIQHKRGEEPGFANTAWTIQVVRGFVLWALAAALAWPMAAFFAMPELLYLLPVVGMAAAISGFDSTAFWLARRRHMLGRVVALELATQVYGLVFTIGLAAAFWLMRPWFESNGYNIKLVGAGTLAVGGLLTPALRMVASHFVLGRSRNGFAWDRTAAESIFHFGKWIFVSTLLTFFAAHTDRILVGKLLGDGALGVYNVGQNMALMIPSAVIALGNAVVFPVLSRVHRENPGDLRRQVRRLRRAVLLPSVLGLSLLIILGGWIIRILYPASFHDAGWVLQLLAAGSCAMLVSLTYGNAMLAQGRSREITIILASQIACLVAGALLGYHLFPLLWAAGDAPAWAPKAGLVGGFALTEWLNYPVVRWRARKAGILNPGLDAAVFAIAGSAAALAFLLR
jgi:O-antigen/teichoic acid export membrane protein